jgi:hypothetical protein
MNIKTKLILATAAVALFSAPASARIDGDDSQASAYPQVNSQGYPVNGATSAFASGRIVQPRATVQRPQRLHNSQPQW